MKLRWLFLAVALFSLLSQSLSAQPLDFRAVRGLPLTDRPILSADVYGWGEPQLLVALEQSIQIYDGLTLSGTISGFVGQVTAMAAADFLDRGSNQLLVATDNAGALYIYEEVNGLWERALEPHFSWSPAKKIVPLHLIGNGGAQVALLNENEELHIFDIEDGVWKPLWASAFQETVADLAAADITGSGREELAYIRAANYAGVLGWNEGQIVLKTEQFPWGPILALAVQRARDNVPGRMTVITGDHTVFLWQYTAGSFQLRLQLEAGDLGRWVGWDKSVGFWTSVDGGTALFSVTPEGLIMQPVRSGVVGTDVSFHNDHWLVRDSQGQVQLWEPVDPQEFDLRVDGREVADMPRVLWQDGHLLLAADDMVDLLNLDYDSGRLQHLFADAAFSIRANRPWLELDNAILIPISPAPVAVDGILYVPLTVWSQTGFDYHWDETLRKLEFQTGLDWFFWQSDELGSDQ